MAKPKDSMSNSQCQCSMAPQNRLLVEFWGLKAITQRMGCSAAQLHRLVDQFQFPLILLPNWKRRHPRNMAFRLKYYTSEALINQWYFALARVQRNAKEKLGGRWWVHLGKARRPGLSGEGAEKKLRARGRQ